MSLPTGEHSHFADSPPGYDPTRVPAQLTDAEIFQYQRVIVARIFENEDIIQRIYAFSKECFALKKGLYKTLNELKTFHSRLKSGSVPSLVDSFQDCINEYEPLLSSVQSFACYAAGQIIDSYNNIVVAAAKGGVSKEKVPGMLERLIRSKPSSSPHVRKSQIHHTQLLKSLETFSTTFSAAEQAELSESDVDIRVASRRVVKCKREVARLQKEVDTPSANTLKFLSHYLAYAMTPNQPSQMMVKGLERGASEVDQINQKRVDRSVAKDGARDDPLNTETEAMINVEAKLIGQRLSMVSNLYDGSSEFDVDLRITAAADQCRKEEVRPLEAAQKNQKQAEGDLRALIAEREAERNESHRSLKTKISVMAGQIESIGNKLTMMPNLCDGIIYKASAFKAFLDSEQSNDPYSTRMQCEIDDLESYGEVWRPVRSALLVFATAVE